MTIRMTKTNVALTAFFVSVPVLLFFQNCSQSGALGLSSAASVNAKTASDTLVVAAPPSTTSSNTPNDIQVDDPVVNPDGSSGEKSSIMHCDQINVSDVLLNIASVSSENNSDFEIVDTDKSISLEKMSLKIKALKNESVHELFLLLEATGNKVLTIDNVVIDLKTPSGQETGVKASLDQDRSIIAGEVYNLVLVFNAKDQVVTNKNSCLFKPVIHSAKLE